MVKTNKILFAVMLLIAVVIGTSLVCHGNAMAPPSIVIIVPNEPNNLELGIEWNEEYVKANRINKIVEAHYTFYLYSFRSTKKINLIIDTEDRTFQIPLDGDLKSHTNVFTLDLENQTLTMEKSLSRSATLVSIRVFLTLTIEALVFLIFGYRQKKSWIIFLVINLITQGFLNIWLAGFGPLTTGYVILALIFAEILILIVEMFTLLIFIKEHRRLRTALFVLLANLLSLIVGGYLITILPL
ncbi:MAG: hypothetical protein COA82_09620 [Alkaliphilus sp.]|nr:MAG: hypothetical protein COA82_09620 [Alkaliphilus sp.]